jgi:hypothetical protein
LTRALISTYLCEPTAVRYYRERLFEVIAKRAIEQAQHIYKNRGSQGGEGGKSNGK